MPLRPIDMERILIAHGWTLKAQNGSHRHYIHPTRPGKVTIPFHSKDIPKGTEHAILKQAGINPSYQ